MNEHYIVLRSQRGVGWIAEGQPSSFKTARGLRDVLRSKWGRGRIMMCKVIE